MQPSDFFDWVEYPDSDGGRSVLDADLVDSFRLRPREDISDLDAAYGLTRLARDELVAFGTGMNNSLNDEGISIVLRTLRAVLRRLDVEFDPPFRDFARFRDYWIRHDMQNSYAARRNYLNGLFNPVFTQLEQLEDEQASTSVRGVDGQLKNIIFASTGPKPRIVIQDAINNIIEVEENAEYCLVYDRPLSEAGLTWADLVDWWKAGNGLGDQDDLEVARDLYRRLAESLDSPPETTLFRTYCERYGPAKEGWGLPALLPQVYLQYDPRTRRERGGRPSVLMRERIDFLLLLPQAVRIVLEVDGKQHYAEGDTASPRLYSEMVSADRRLRLRGYEVYRFGGYELAVAGAADMLRRFFDELLATYEVGSGELRTSRKARIV
jgi:hypothetical protein